MKYVSFFIPLGGALTWHCVIIVVSKKYWLKSMDVNFITIKARKDRWSGWSNHNLSVFQHFADYLQYASTQTAYVHTLGEMKTYIVNWRDKRIHFNFKAFVSVDGSSSNLTEVVHSRWKNSHVINLSFLRSAKKISNTVCIKQWINYLRSSKFIFWETEMYLVSITPEIYFFWLN